VKRRAALAGLFGSAVLVLAAGVLHTVAPPVPFLPEALAQALVRAPPGSVSSFLIDLLGYWAQRLALVGTAVAFAGSGVLLGLAMPWLIRRTGWNRLWAGAVAFLPLWAVSVALYPSPEPPSIGRWAFALVTLPMYVLAGAAAGRVMDRLDRAGDEARDEGGPAVADVSRRRLLAAIGLGGVGVVIGVSDLGRLFHQRPDPGRLLLRVSDLEPVSPPTPDPDFARITGLSPEVTPLDDFYVVDESLIDPDIDPASWRLAVGGLVERPLALTYEQLKRFPVVERYQTLECVSNEVGGDLISTARWAGVPLRLILDRAGIRPGAVEVVFRASGGYSDSLPLDHAMDDSTLIAIGMNGHVLPRAHGFPARLLSVGTYGMKNPKWLTSIEVVDRPYQGYWEARGWSKPAVVKTFSRIDTPRNGGRVDGGAVLAGVAFAGDRGVRRVDISTDGGRTWSPADLKDPLSAYTWQLWRYPWRPDATGRFGVLVRAVDGTGAVQVRSATDPYPDGSSGYHAISLRR
jgi:DMSO/TMAO reductase YedYZ molybdopterin-dependent catalytic subunit